MNVEELRKVFETGAGIAPEGYDSIVIGTLIPLDADAGMDAVMHHHTKHIDFLLSALPLGDTQRLRLQFLRVYTFEEFSALFDNSIAESDYREHPIFLSFLITTAKERKRFIYSLTNTRYEYNRLLEKSLRAFHPQMYNFLYEAHYDSTNF